MKVIIGRNLHWAIIIGLCITIFDCGSSNRLREYRFSNNSAAAIVSAPPAPEVFTESFFDVDSQDLLGSVLRLGGNIAKEIEAAEARARLDSAMQLVDVPDRIRIRTLERGSKYMHYRSIDDEDAADFLFDIFINHYGIEAKSWDAGVYFEVDLHVYLLDNETGLEIWKKHFKERQPISRTSFLADETAAEDVVTAVVLAGLSVEEMARGFKRLADYTADRITQKLRKDFQKSRQEG
jgi:hypothetical protein